MKKHQSFGLRPSQDVGELGNRRALGEFQGLSQECPVQELTHTTEKIRRFPGTVKAATTAASPLAAASRPD
jgi:hypothetical protein